MPGLVATLLRAHLGSGPAGFVLSAEFSCFASRYIFRFYPGAFNFLADLSSTDRYTNMCPFSSGGFNLASALLGKCEKRPQVAVGLRGVIAPLLGT